MEKNFKRLIQISWMRRNSVMLSNYRIVLHKKPQNFCSCSQDILAYSRETKPSENNTEKFNKLQWLDGYLNVLQKYKDDYKKMDERIIVNILSALFSEIKDKPCNIDVQKNEQFVQLCDAINENIRRLSLQDLILVLKILTMLKVSSQSLLLNTVFQLLTIRVSEIPVVNIPFLHFLLLLQDERIPLVKALLTAIPIVFENECKKQLDATNIKNVTEMFRYACENCNQSTVSVIAETLMKNSYIDLGNAKSIYISIGKLNAIPAMCLKLLSVVQSLLANNANNLSLTEMLHMFYVIRKKAKVQQTEFYPMYLIDALTNACLAFNPELSFSYDILKILNNLSYSHIPLLDHFAEQCFGDSNFWTTYPFYMVESVKALTIVNYKPVFWNRIQDIILNNEFSFNSFDTRVIHFALDAISLDCYTPHLVKLAFQASILGSMKYLRDSEKHKLLLLYQSIKTLYPEYNGPWPNTSILQQAQGFDQSFHNDSLNNALEWAVGGAQYIRSSLKTSLGHFIDHVVVIQAEGQAVVINSDKDADKNTEFIEDIKPPLNSRMVLIFIFPTMAYSVNNQHLKSTWCLKLRSVKKLVDCSTIAINSGLWSNLPEREKIPYLRQAIRLTRDNKPVSRICQYV